MTPHNNQAPQRRTCAKPRCGVPASDQLKCSRCNVVHYCVRKHQFADLKRHKSECTNPALPPQLPSAASHTASDSVEGCHTVDIVFFPASGLPARIITMECSLHNNPVYHGLKEEWIDFRTCIDAPSVTSAAIGPVRRSSVPHSRLYIGWNEDAVLDGAEENFCIQRYTKGLHDFVWYGNLIGYRAREPVRKHMQYLDATDKDIDAFASFFKNHGLKHPGMPEVVVHHLYE